jgi:hypothetical protein
MALKVKSDCPNELLENLIDRNAYNFVENQIGRFLTNEQKKKKWNFSVPS